MKNGVYKDNQGRKPQTPITLGRDCTGVVVAVGSLVGNFKVGDEVWACVPPEHDGTFAEYAKVKFFWAAPKPKNYSFEACTSHSPNFHSSFSLNNDLFVCETLSKTIFASVPRSFSH
jgi:NADPH:quinone reductase-like Zn-dependent oxidoreductase